MSSPCDQRLDGHKFLLRWKQLSPEHPEYRNYPFGLVPTSGECVRCGYRKTFKDNFGGSDNG